MLAPTFVNISYGPHDNQKIDLWLPKGNGPFPFYLNIHGGGFVEGSRRPVPIQLIESLTNQGVALATIDYRFADDPEYLAPYKDGQRALQFLRHHAASFKLDKTIAAIGGDSAGAIISFWIGFAPDRAEPDSTDPIARESTAVTCIACHEAVTSFDPHYLKKILPGSAWTTPLLANLLRVPFEQYDTPEAMAKFKAIHSLDWVHPNSPPVFLFNRSPNIPLTADSTIDESIHHPRIGVALNEILEPLGVECVLRVSETCPAGMDKQAFHLSLFSELGAFVVKKLKP